MLARAGRRFVAVATLLVAVACAAETRNGFDLDNALVPPDEIRRGGVPRDAIPALNWPETIAAADADYLEPDDRILGLVIDGRPRAYPVRILNYHEIVNDIVAGKPVTVTYCPLCRSGVAFDATVAGRARVFGVSGLLYDSDLLMFDRETESLWSQLGARAISGPSAGQKLETVPLRHTTWADWIERHPDSLVLAPATGHRRDYTRDPYTSYARSRGLMFPVSGRDGRLPAKTRVLGLTIDGQARAWPLPDVAGHTEAIRERLGDEVVTVHYDAAADALWATTADGRLLDAVDTYWFAWYTFHPDTTLYSAEPSD